jgi:multidrug resistance efflux pump
MNIKPAIVKYVLTGAVVLVAALAVLWKYWAYVTNPWTRDGQVRANVIQVAPRVSGPIVDLPIKDNQFVEAGDLLFEIDPRTYQAALDQASAQLDDTRDNLKDLEQRVKASGAALDQTASQIKQAQSAVKSAQAEFVRAQKDFERASDLVKKGDISKRNFDQSKASYDVAQADLDKARSRLIQANAARLQAEAELARAKADLGAPGEENAQLRAAKAALKTAELNLEFTRVKASVDGYVTNLNLRLGSQAVANRPALALVDVNSYWVHGYFRETLVGRIKPGNRAVITLMSFPDKPLTGVVDSLGWGIAQQDGSTGQDLLPSISPTFEWIRLAQRVPVRVHLEQVPDEVELRVGTTASVLVMAGTHGEESKEPVPAAPRALQ